MSPSFADTELLPISALQHLLFCERQCALIHIERLWAENRLTVEGGLMHKRAHAPKRMPGDRRTGVRTVRGLELFSHRLGLLGVADLVEFHDAAGGADLSDALPPMVVPVEYKRGRPKRHDADVVQLCAQALCLEEMLRPDRPPGWIEHGAIFYGQTRRRLEVALDYQLRAKTERAVLRLHELIASGVTPIARREKKCDRCSLLHLCLPGALRPRQTAGTYLTRAVASALAT